MKKLIVSLALVLALAFGCATVPNTAKEQNYSSQTETIVDRPSLEEKYGYTKAEYDKLIRHLALLGKIEERIVFAFRTHYQSGYDTTDKSKYWVFQITKRINDPSEGVQLHAFVMKYYPTNSEGKRRTEWRRNWIFFDDDIDGYPDRYITSFWSVGEDGKLKIDYNIIKSMNDLPESKWEETYYNLRQNLWKSFIKQLMKKPFDYYRAEEPKK